MCVPAVPLALIENEAAQEMKLRVKVKSLSLRVSDTHTSSCSLSDTRSYAQSYCAMVIGHPSTRLIKGKRARDEEAGDTERRSEIV